MEYFKFIVYLIYRLEFSSHFHLNTDENDGYNYFWTSLKNKDPSKYYPNIAVKLMHMAIELQQTENGTAPGYRVIIDSTDVGLSHAMRFSIISVKNSMVYVQVIFHQAFFFFFKRHI